MKRKWKRICCLVIAVALISVTVPLQSYQVHAQTVTENDNQDEEMEEHSSTLEEIESDEDTDTGSEIEESGDTELSTEENTDTEPEIEESEDIELSTEENTDTESELEESEDIELSTEENTDTESEIEESGDTESSTEEDTNIESDKEAPQIKIVSSPKIVEKDNKTIYVSNKYNLEISGQGVLVNSNSNKVIIEKGATKDDNTEYVIKVEDGIYNHAINLNAKDEHGRESTIELVPAGTIVDAVAPEIVVTATAGGKEYDGRLTGEQIIIEVEVRGAESGIYAKEIYVVNDEKAGKEEKVGDFTECKNGNKYVYKIGEDKTGKEVDMEDLIVKDVELAMLSNNYTDQAPTTYKIKFTANSGKSDEAQLAVRYKNVDLTQGQVYTKTSPASSGFYNSETGNPTVYFEFPSSCPKEDFNITMCCEIVRNRNETVFSSDLRHRNTMYEITEDGLYEIKIYTKDDIGNRTDTYVYHLRKDSTPPEDVRILINGNDVTSINGRTNLYQIFANVNQSVSITNEANDIASIDAKIFNDLGEEIGQSTENGFSISPNVKGFIQANVSDEAGNKATYFSYGFVIDDVAPGSSKSGNISIKANGANENGFINANSIIEVDVADKPSTGNCASLMAVDYIITNSHGDKETNNIHSFTNTIATSEELDRAASIIEKINVDVSKYNEEDISVEVIAKDKAGNQSNNIQTLKIDTVSPEISITFDDSNPINGRFYKNNRVAYITVTEKNFDPNLVTITVMKDGVASNELVPLADSWKENGNKHTAQIVFTEDATYTLSARCKDLADNESNAVEIEPFTIDKTQPVVEISYNHEPYAEGYYSATLIATVVVTESNFDEKQFTINSTSQMSIGEWTHSGKTHKADIIFGQDGEYIYTIECTDMAGNKMESMDPQHFILDTILPYISITGVQDEYSYSGEVYPIVNIKDANLNVAETEVKLTNGKGHAIQLDSNIIEKGNEVTYELLNVSSQQDAVYHLDVISVDKAGNKSRCSYRFSLNRNGSTYDLSSTADIVGRVYNKYQDIVDIKIVETNVDKIDEFNIYSTYNGKLLNGKLVSEKPKTFNKNAVYYSVNSYGNVEDGYTYEYTIYRENFINEGTYNLTFSSIDHAGNRTDNTLKKDDEIISFIVDDTVPTVYIYGVESGGSYKSESIQVSAYVTDNTSLKEAEFYLVDENGDKTYTWNYMELIEREGDSITLTIPESEGKQSLLFRAKDAAGNEINAKENDEGVPTGFVISTKAKKQDNNIEIEPETVPMANNINNGGIPGFVYLLIVVVGFLLITITVINKKRCEKSITESED